ncbi:hypothetical protein GQ53DRAFT_549574 [Thozetella sp. PMI_491]|nr:hypothetical protein GQ53DRAFT_549574 [Thozetella sp. PMI_491]
MASHATAAGSARHAPGSMRWEQGALDLCVVLSGFTAFVVMEARDKSAGPSAWRRDPMAAVSGRRCSAHAAVQTWESTQTRCIMPLRLGLGTFGMHERHPHPRASMGG